MKKIIIEEVLEQHQTVVDVLCNKCEKSCQTDCGYEGLIEAVVRGGYGSKIGDDVEFVFSLCEDCLIDLLSSFKIKEEIISAPPWYNESVLE